MPSMLIQQVQLVPILATGEALMPNLFHRETLTLAPDSKYALGRNEVTGIADRRVSRLLANIVWKSTQQEVFIEDNKGNALLYKNGRRVGQANDNMEPLKDGDVLALGKKNTGELQYKYRVSIQRQQPQHFHYQQQQTQNRQSRQRLQQHHHQQQQQELISDDSSLSMLNFDLMDQVILPETTVRQPPVNGVKRRRPDVHDPLQLPVSPPEYQGGQLPQDALFLCSTSSDDGGANQETRVSIDEATRLLDPIGDFDSRPLQYEPTTSTTPVPHSAAEEFMCSYCLDIQVESTTLSPCGHSFCMRCIDTMRGGGANECPTCRAPIQSLAPCRVLNNVIAALCKDGSNFFSPDDVSVYRERFASVAQQHGPPVRTDPPASHKRRRLAAAFRPTQRQQLASQSAGGGLSGEDPICID